MLLLINIVLIAMLFGFGVEFMLTLKKSEGKDIENVRASLIMRINIITLLTALIGIITIINIIAGR